MLDLPPQRATRLARIRNALQVAGWTVTPWTLHDQKIAYCLMGDLGRMMQARRNRVLARLAARPFGQK